MYLISQFSKISGLTIKALRYYDEKGILIPNYRNNENKYRYYSDDDLKKALLIKLLRSLDFSIMEITEILDLVKNKEDLTYILQEKIKHIEKNISKEKDLIKKINNNTVSLIKESNFITIKSILLKLMKYMLPQLDLLVIIRI
ncbi:MAG: MerR family transcriptional regulator [Thomasclavelia sp.]|uniref:MerR family transcriptional regulator n=1 Tax=Thomasclavelia sp. TaxID=3025757 RepID=UPI0039A0E206